MWWSRHRVRRDRSRCAEADGRDSDRLARAYRRTDLECRHRAWRTRRAHICARCDLAEGVRSACHGAFARGAPCPAGNDRAGDGLLVSVASAAGLLSQVGDAAYSATKHAAVSLAQSLAIEHGHQGIRVSVVCPQYVATPLLGYEGEDRPAHPGVLSADVVAQRIVQGIKDDLFLILPHPETAAYFRMRAEAPEAWISGMQRLRARVMQDGPLDLKTLHRRV